MKSIPQNVYWTTLKDPKLEGELVSNISTEFVVIGGGIAGLSCAQRLLAFGKKVILLEKDFIGSGASGKTSGFITPDSEIELGSLLETYGPEKAKKIWEFVVSGVELIKNNIEKYNIDCDYQVQDSLFIANNLSGFKHIKEEHKAREELGYKSTLYNKNELESVIGSNGYVGAVSYPDTFGMNSYLYCQAMKEILRNEGVIIYEKTPVVKIEDNSVITLKGSVMGEKIVVCTDRFIPELGVLEKEIYHVQTFLGLSKPLSEDQVKKIFPNEKKMVWDTDLVYNYFRLTGDNRLLIGGGDLFYTYAKNISTNTPRFGRRLKKYIDKKFPNLKIEMEYLWPGMLGVSKDLLPIIGPDKKNDSVYYVGAATGLPWASALGVYSAEHFITNRNEFDEVFSPDRKFVIGKKFQTILRNPATFAVSHGIAKYL